MRVAPNQVAHMWVAATHGYLQLAEQPLHFVINGRHHLYQCDFRSFHAERVQHLTGWPTELAL
jgi:hypothetical protein